MLDKINPIKTTAWKRLEDHYRIMKDRRMIDLFVEDPERFFGFSLRFEDITVDYSKNMITEETLRFLLELAEE